MTSITWIISRAIFSESRLYSDGGRKTPKKKIHNNNGSLAVGGWDNSPFQMRIIRMRMCTIHTHLSTFSTHTHSMLYTRQSIKCVIKCSVFLMQIHSLYTYTSICVGSSWKRFVLRCVCLCERFFCIFPCLNQSV